MRLPAHKPKSSQNLPKGRLRALQARKLLLFLKNRCVVSSEMELARESGEIGSEPLSPRRALTAFCDMG